MSEYRGGGGRRRGGRGGGHQRGNHWDRHGEQPQPDNMASKIQNQQLRDAFLGFQTELDERHDRKERIVKLGRDVTIESKRIIFLLHRITTMATPQDRNSLFDDAWSRLELLRTNNFQWIAEELDGQDSYLFLRAYSGGLQEYIEALSFFYFLRESRLISCEEVQMGLVYLRRKPEPKQDENWKRGKPPDSESTVLSALKSEESSRKSSSAAEATQKQPSDAINTETVPKETENEPETDEPIRKIKVQVPVVEYILGIGDIAGETMRFAINSISSGDMDSPGDVAKFLGILYQGYSSIQTFLRYSRDYGQKLNVLRQSLDKVEQALYVLHLRRSELPKEMLADAVALWAPDNRHTSLEEYEYNY